MTTAKDEVKLDAAMRLRLKAVAPLRIASLVVAMKDEDAVRSELARDLSFKLSDGELKVFRSLAVVSSSAFPVRHLSRCKS